MSQLDFALVGNCQISALLDKNARYVWGCMPRLDSPSIFSALIGGEDAGFWSCEPEQPGFTTKQSYLRNSNVVCTEFHLANGDRFDVVDFIPRFAHRDSYFRPPILMRILRPVRGNPRLVMRMRPRFGYGEFEPQTSLDGGAIVFRGPRDALFFHANIPYSYILEERPFDLTQTRYCVLSHGTPFTQPLKFACEEYCDRTLHYWRTWVKHCNIPFEYQDEVIRSALALKLHIFEDTGAIIAATTTSVPEGPEGGRNWDYRYCWLRDAYFVVSALNQLGQFDEMEHFIEYLHTIAANEAQRGSKGHLQPVYGITGENVLTERELPWLKGFHGYGPVRVGNAAYTHSQYDVYGEMVLAVSPLFFDSRLTSTDLDRAFEVVETLVDQAIQRFELPDSGIWEFRSGQRHYVFSKLLCWAAVDRGMQIAKRLGRSENEARWASASQEMRQVIETRAWSDALGGYTQAYDLPVSDASNLLIRMIKFHPGDHPRMKQMVDTYEKTLMSHGYMYRYRNEDDFGKPQHAFTICSFWMIDALCAVGRTEQARGMFEALIARANHVGLLSEDIDPISGELWGNFPQTYSHVGVINSAFLLSKSWAEVF